MANAEVFSVIETVHCCRDWPVVTQTFTHGERGVKHEYWWWRKCGLCGQQPYLLRRDANEED